MEPSRVVEILQDGKSRGSGYLITPRHVLTTRNVLKPPVVGTDCAIHLPLGGAEQAVPFSQGHRLQPVSAKVGWVSSEHDFALIEVSGDPLCSAKTGPLPFGKVPVDGLARQVIGSGFPEAAGDAGDQRTIVGTLTWVLGRRFDIDVISAIPRDWTKWAGISGTAIFADNILVGVVHSLDVNWHGRVLEATPVTWLLDDISFKKYIEDAGLSLPHLLDVGAATRSDLSGGDIGRAKGNAPLITGARTSAIQKSVVKVFISYRHVDHKIVDDVRNQLGWLEQNKSIYVFDDRSISGGEDWNQRILKELGQADIIILLVSAAFMRSTYCTQIELREALIARAGRGTIIIPVIVETCDWEAMPIRNIAALPKDKANDLKPLNKWYRDKDVALTQVAKNVRQYVEAWL